jgi:hypothetical protein
MFDEAAWVGGIYLRDLLSPLCYEKKVHRTKAGQRKLRLYGCASCRRIWPLIPEGPCRRTVETAERYADGRATKQDLKEALRPAVPFLGVGPGPEHRDAVQAVFRVAAPESKRAAWAGVDASSAHHGGAWTKDDGIFCVLLREVFGNPFRPMVAEQSWLTWNGGTVVKLAKAVYEDRAFDTLPVVADALEDAGCTDPVVLSHLRGLGPHVPGCWAVDLLLGRG